LNFLSYEEVKCI